MFEKDSYALIRGLRNHKGNEREYIQESIKECRKEIRSQDMDQKAQASMKLVYLEMFGHDMSWASFNVSEVMSSQKYLQKRVGYSAAVQSFRPDTEVLMSAENLSKKDLTSPHPITIHLPLGTIPHVINPSMANSLLGDLLPRLTHSQPAIRKKTIVTLYRLALVYPETLRPAWPKIKERLLDEKEDPSVTSAIINVVCELGWRRPQDFLPLAPRLFDLLVQGGNNWMAIKIIKSFATSTPLEPRLVKKLSPPLTSIIKTTPAMSLLYECINGIIQGGILEGAEGTVEGDEIARSCVSKSRGMLVVEGDPNLKYVALLAFTKIVASHPQLVSMHQDVIMECIDDPDISIRIRASELVVGMVVANNLVPIVERLLRQLREASPASAADSPSNDKGSHEGVMPSADSDEEGAAESLRRSEKRSDQPPPLPEDYRNSVLEKILDMCSRDSYANINDFEWYIGVLVELVRHCPTTTDVSNGSESFGSKQSVADIIGQESSNVAVRVKSVRSEATAAAQSLLLIERRQDSFPASGVAAQGVLTAAAWIAGEYASLSPDPNAVLSSLLHSSSTHLPAPVLSTYLQAMPKVFVRMTSDEQQSWTAMRKSNTTLLMARIIHFLEPLVLHPSLEVQERAVEYSELMRLASEAASGQPPQSSDEGYADAPLLLTQAIPSLFTGIELNPVAVGALRKVPLTDGLDLDAPINDQLQMLLQQADYDELAVSDEDDTYRFYFEKPKTVIQSTAAADMLDIPDSNATSYQQTAESKVLDPEALARIKAERRERYGNDPFYIDSERNSGTSTPLHNILKTNNVEESDIDSIPIMDLQLDSKDSGAERNTTPQLSKPKKSRKRVEVAADETIEGDEDAQAAPTRSQPIPLSRGKKAFLQVDSSGLSSFSLSEDAGNAATQLDIERRQQEEEEMARAMKEVERSRSEMQRAQERIQAKDIPEEGMVVKRKKKKKKPRVELLGGEEEADGQNENGKVTVNKKKKKKKVIEDDGAQAAAEEGATEAVATPKPKKKKKRQVVFDEPYTAEAT